jgi:hypothetical protein
MTLPGRLPLPLPGRSSAAGETYALEGVQYHIALGGMPFLLAPGPERPLIRELAQSRKQQFDNQEIPGEQSLADWWLRSQSTFVGGAGLLYQDPDVTNRWAVQYGSSQGVDPWTNGKLSLLHTTAMDIADGTSARHHVLGYDDGTDRYWSAVGTNLRSSTGSGSPTSVTWGGTGTIQSLTSDGTRYFVADEDGVYSGEGAGAGSLAWDTGSPDVVVGWAKGRLMMGLDNAVYELAGGSPPALPTPIFTHLNSAWRWSAVAEGPNAIYVAGHAGAKSDIYKFELTDVGGTPTLEGGGTQAAQLPHGERVLALYGYLGTYMGIGTSRGLRVGQIDDRGDIAYGPLLIEQPVRSMIGYDRFLFAACEGGMADGASGLHRVDLGQVTSDDGPSPGLRYAYATDLQAHVAGEVDSVTLLGSSDTPVFTVRGEGSFVRSDDLEPTGYLLTGRVRYNTLVNKHFKFLTVRSEQPIAGSITASVIDPTGGETSIMTVAGGNGRRIENALIQTPVTTAEWMQLRITMNRGSEIEGPEVTGWQFKALPGEQRQRVWTLPLLCTDHEEDVNGVIVGREGRTQARLEALERLASRGDVIAYQDLRASTQLMVLIEELEFRQDAPPGTADSTYGGILYVRLRTIGDLPS